MRSEAACEAARLRLSARLDGQLDSPERSELDDHLARCADCRFYEQHLHDLRRSLRLVPAPPTPDLTNQIVADISRQDPRRLRTFRVKLASVAAAAAALLVLASALPIFERTPDVARGAEITRRAFAAARSLTRYHATFRITERGWHDEIPVRRFSAEMWFDAPESFRLVMTDRTVYPGAAWPKNDVEVVTNPTAWSIRETYSCPPAALPACAIRAGSEERTTINRQPFDGASDAPRDLVVPLDSLVSSDTFVVAGRATVRNRDAYHLVLPYRHAFPLVEALQIGGSWTPLHPGDTVDLWVDAETSFPLRFRASRDERVLLEVETHRLDEPSRLPADLFEVVSRGAISDGGFTAGRGPSAEALPTYVSGLQPYRSGRNRQQQRIAAYADGLSYLTVRVDRAGGPAALLMQPAEVVELDGGSRAFYRPAGPDAPRRLDVYSGRHHVQLASNLTRTELLRIGASLELKGRAPALVRAGKTTIERLEPTAAATIGYARTFTELPPGYALVTAVRTSGPRSSQLIAHYMPTESGSAGSSIRVVQSPHVDALPPTSEDLLSVRIDGVLGRWSQARGELEWIAPDGVYRAVAAPSFDLAYVLDLARGMR